APPPRSQYQFPHVVSHSSPRSFTQRRWLGSVAISSAAAPEPVFTRGKAREAKFGISNKRRVTPHRVKTGPARRVAREMTPAVVVGLGKGVTIACVLRLTWRHFSQQRGSRRNGNRP